MAGSTHQSRKAWELVRRQYGIVTRDQLRALGYGRHAVAHRIGKGFLFPLARGVYAVGRPEVSDKGRWMAAVLACGDGAVLSHSSATALWRIGPEKRGSIEL